jgi:hypothetical protein
MYLLQAIAFNYAAIDGNNVIGRGIISYNLLAQSHCSEGSVGSVSVASELYASLAVANSSFDVNLRRGREVRGCVDGSELDASFYLSCCGSGSGSSGNGRKSKGYSTFVPSLNYAEAVLSSDEWPMDWNAAWRGDDNVTAFCSEGGGGECPVEASSSR